MGFFRALLLCLFSILPLSAGEEEVVDTQLDGARLEFKARTIESAKRAPGSGFSVFEGELYIAIGDPPSRVMNSGKLWIGEREITLDVSGLGDPWVDPTLERRFVRLAHDESTSISTLQVCFVKGGAGDYMVKWVISGGASMRVAIERLGDTYPDWVKESE
jgi:hypothetical protein